MAEPFPAPRARTRPRRHRLPSPDARLVLRAYTPGPGVGVVSAGGEIDLANHHALAAALDTAAADPAIRLLVCDLSETTFLACSGLSVLLEVKAELEARRAFLRVVAADPAVLRVLDVTGQREVLDVRPDISDAVPTPMPASLPIPTGLAEPALDADLAELRAALDRAVEQTIALAATWGRLAEQVSVLDADGLVDGRGGHWRPKDTLADMAEDLRVLQNHLATGALLAAPTVEDLAHLRLTEDA